MLPIFMSEDINYAQDGMRSFVAMYARSLVVVDGEALIGVSGDDVDWNTALPRRILIDRLLDGIREACPTPPKDIKSTGIVPIAMPTNGDDAAAWRAMIVNLPTQNGFMRVPRPNSIDQVDELLEKSLAEHAQVFADRWQKATGCECVVLNHRAGFEGTTRIFTQAFKSGILRKTGEVMCETQAVNMEVRRHIDAVRELLVNSALREDTPQANSIERGLRF